MKLELRGQVALIRGTYGPWGRAVAESLSACGASIVDDASPAKLRQTPGRLDMLVNAEPALIETATVPPFAAMRLAMAACRDAASAMTSGRIVNIGSVFGLVPRRGEAAVAAASAALFAESRALALDLAPRGVLLNAVAVMAEARPHTPLGRAARPDEVAAAVLFLLASASSYVVGEVLRVDGGWSVGFARDF